MSSQSFGQDIGSEERSDDSGSRSSDRAFLDDTVQMVKYHHARVFEHSDDSQGGHSDYSQGHPAERRGRSWTPTPSPSPVRRRVAEYHPRVIQDSDQEWELAPPSPFQEGEPQDPPYTETQIVPQVLTQEAVAPEEAPVPFNLTEEELNIVARRLVPTARGVFCFNTMRMFITFPMNASDHRSVYNRIVEHYGNQNIQHLIVGAEPHQDGTPHLHICIVLRKQTRTNSAQMESWLDPLHVKGGDYRRIQGGDRDLARVYVYCGKGGNYVQLNPHDYEVFRQQATSAAVALTDERRKTKVKNKELVAKWSTIATGLNEEKRDRELALFSLENPAFVFQFGNKMQTGRAMLVQAAAYTVTRPPFPGLKWVEGNELRFAQAAHFGTMKAWFDLNLPEGYTRELRRRRPIRDKQLWIKGVPGIGKTTFLARLYETLKVFPWNVRENFTVYQNFVYDLIILDEYTGGLPLHFLNAMVDGSQTPLTVKNGNSIGKLENLPVIVCSNSSPDEVYRAHFDANPNQRGCLEGPAGRFTVVTLAEEQKIYEFLFV